MNYSDQLNSFMPQGAVSTVTGRPEVPFEDRISLLKEIFSALSYVKGNVFPRNDYKFDLRQPGTEGIYAEPEITLGQSGAWKKPFLTFYNYIMKNPDAPLSQIIKDTKLSEYQVTTLKKLMEQNLGS